MDKITATTMFESLSSGVRLDIVRLLVSHGREGLVAGEIAQALDIPRTNLSFHLKTLTQAGMVSVIQEGRYQRYRADLAAMQDLVSYLTEHCCAAESGACDLSGPAAFPEPCPDASSDSPPFKEHAMKSIRVYDPSLCCNTGVCGPEVDQSLVDFSAAVRWALDQDIDIERMNLAQQPMAFADNPVVRAFLEEHGEQGLPLVLVDGAIAVSGRYPDRAELAALADVPAPAEAAEAAASGEGCCGPADNSGCC